MVNGMAIAIRKALAYYFFYFKHYLDNQLTIICSPMATLEYSNRL
jgi:hypothetical protein